jgi:uncharacterized iron-regulated protein
MRRRTLLSSGAAAALCACASSGGAARERIVDVASGRVVSRADVLDRMRDSDFVLLGELHDNALHHERRAALLRDLGRPTTVVVEQLPSAAAPALDRHARGNDLLQALQGAGFDARGWGWPLHEPLFAALAAAGHAVRGGNLPRELARRVAMDGPSALPDELRRAIESAPLNAAATSALEGDLIAGHCGQLPASRLPRMVWAQRGRDAAMAAALRDARAGRSETATLLIAGNGHVRRDYGVVPLLLHAQPAARVLSIGFIEGAQDAARPPFDLAWTTAAAAREDPCAGMVIPAAAGAPGRADRTP